MTPEVRHRYISIIVFATSILLIFCAETIDFGTWQPLKSALLSIGTALLALSFIEFVFKGILQRDLISELVQVFKESLDLPVSAIYLRRSDMPAEEDPLNTVKYARNIIYIKANSFAALIAQGFVKDLKEILQGQNEIAVKFIILDPEFEDFQQICSLSGLSEITAKDSIKTLSEELDTLKSDGFDVDYVYTNKFPTAGFWLIDPGSTRSKVKIGFYRHHGEQQSARVNLILSPKDDPIFFQKFIESVESEWSICKEEMKNDHA